MHHEYQVTADRSEVELSYKSLARVLYISQNCPFKNGKMQQTKKKAQLQTYRDMIMYLN